jgi:squalene-hopene/tetraprenyl-beta-curcumene cyclase
MNDTVFLNLLDSPAAPDTTREPGRVESAIENATGALLREQQDDGHWVYELEADTTIPSEYVLMTHYLGETPNAALEARLSRYLRRLQRPDGGWPLYHEGRFDLSASVKTYFALKMIGDDVDAPHMKSARAVIRAHGGAASVNVFTRILLALYGIMPWQAVPVMPVEIMLLPRFSPFHLTKISYWARTVIVPLLVLRALKPRAQNPRNVQITELFIDAPEKTGLLPKARHQTWRWFAFFRTMDAVLRIAEPMVPKPLRNLATRRAVAFVTERVNGEDGLGAIFPAMVNAVEMFDALGVPRDRADVAAARRAIDKLLVIGRDEAYCQPCVSPVWDTALASLALLEAGDKRSVDAALAGIDWLRPLQILNMRGDWADRRPRVPPGGWAFQYANPHYPDVDDTAVVAMALDRAGEILGDDRYGVTLARATEWVIGMQSSDGGWGAFEPENTHYSLNNIPFADHGALLDPPTADASARCLSMLIQLGQTPQKSAAAARALAYLLREQESDGSWYGRWGMNYIYGTWTALCALNAAGMAPHAPEVQRAVSWLVSIQNPDGGWGESGDSYRLDYHGHEPSPSTPSQTAWALIGLMAGGALDHPSVTRGIDYLLKRQNATGLWDEKHFTATGFPGVFYLRYHGYARYFPLWALARYRNMKRGGLRAVSYGM